MTLYTPKEIGLKADYAAKDKHSETVDGWVCHVPGVDRDYTGDLPESFGALRSIEKYSMGKGWWGIPYDYGVDLRGHKFLLRGTAQSGATSGDYDEDGIPNNRESDAILLILGNDQEVTREMMDAVQELVDALGGRRKYFIAHSEAKGTKTGCPGDSVREYIVKPMDAGKDLRDVPAPGYAPAPPPEPHPVEPPTDWRSALYDDIPLVDLSRVSRASSTWVRGDQVRVAQGILVAHNVTPDNTIRPDGTLDGIGGPGTRSALVEVQGRFGLTRDAVAGPKTYKATLRDLQVLDLSDVNRDYRTWERGVVPALVQCLLVASGNAPENTINKDGRVDGVAGPGTRGALVDFQNQNGLKADSIVGPKTYRALLIK